MRPLRRRRIFLAGVVVGAVVVSLAGLGASVLVKSPQQLAAEAAPPEPSLITAAVELREIRKTVTLRGTVERADALSVSPDTSAGDAIVSKQTVERGDSVTPGAVLAEISGRPLILLRGKVPAYRDLTVGDEGTDVRQLHGALRELGFHIGDEAGVFGRSTERAILSMYKNRGYKAPRIAPTATEGEPAAERSRETGSPLQTSSGDASGTYRPQERIRLPMSEVVFTPRLPARVTNVKASLGDEVEDTLLTLSAGGLVVRAMLSPSDRELVELGDRVEIYSEELDNTAAGKVADIGSFTTDGAEQGGEESAPNEEAGLAPPREPGHPLAIEGGEGLTQEFVDKNVRLKIEAASTEDEVLAVPASAVYAAGDGTTRVIKVSGNGQQQRIKVSTGATGGGFVEVRLSEDALKQDDRVVVGR